MDQLYDIQRWDGVLSTNNKPMPLIYVSPDIPLLDFFSANRNRVWVLINNTESGYDGNIYYTTVEKSAVMPNPRPDFFDSTGLYTLALDTTKWFGYPPKNGVITFLDSPDYRKVYSPPRNIIQEVPHQPERVPPPKETFKKISYDTRAGDGTTATNSVICFEQWFVIIFTILFLIFIGLALFYILK